MLTYCTKTNQRGPTMRTGTLLTGIAAFAGGVITGLLISPRNGRENRKWLSEQTKDTRNWIEHKSHNLMEESEKKIDRISKGIRKTVEENVPDLYGATESLYFSDSDEENF